MKQKNQNNKRNQKKPKKQQKLAKQYKIKIMFIQRIQIYKSHRLMNNNKNNIKNNYIKHNWKI